MSSLIKQVTLTVLVVLALFSHLSLFLSSGIYQHLSHSSSFTSSGLLYNVIATPICSEAGVINDARSEIYEAFKAVVEAYNAGGDVSELIGRINEAISVISKAEEIADNNPSEAEKLALKARALAHDVSTEAPIVKEGGLKQRQMAMVTTAASIIGIIIAGILIYVFGPEIFWRIWVRLRKNHIVKVGRSMTRRKSSMIISEEVWAVILAVIIVGAIFAASQHLFSRRVVEPFSELGVLGPKMKIGDYPREIVAGETVKLHVYVGNHIGKPVYYIVMVKLGDNKTSINPAPIEPFIKYERVLPHNATWLFPINITLVETGLNQRIIFELWVYNETSSEIEYHQRWCQIWVNVTAPIR